jgi:hypothetical protein
MTRRPTPPTRRQRKKSAANAPPTARHPPRQRGANPPTPRRANPPYPPQPLARLPAQSADRGSGCATLALHCAGPLRRKSKSQPVTLKSHAAITKCRPAPSLSAAKKVRRARLILSAVRPASLTCTQELSGTVRFDRRQCLQRFCASDLASRSCNGAGWEAIGKQA